MACNYKGAASENCTSALSDYYDSPGYWGSNHATDCAGYVYVAEFENYGGKQLYEHTEYTDPNVPPSLKIYDEYTLLATLYNQYDFGHCGSTGVANVKQYKYARLDNSSAFLSFDLYNCWIQYTDYYTSYIHYSAIGDEDDFPTCEPWEYFDPELGLCQLSPGWEEDPDNPGTWIPTACLSVEKTEEYIHDNGAETYIYVGRTWTYKVYSQNGELFSEDTVVYLSYAGSTVTNGVEFDSPSSVIIPAGKNYVDFELTVNVHPDAYQEFIKIEAISETYSSCETTSNQILSEKSTPEDVIGECSSKFIPEDITDCHDFFKYYPANYPEIY